MSYSKVPGVKHLYERNGRYFRKRSVKKKIHWEPLRAAPPNVRDAELEIAGLISQPKRAAKRNVRVDDAFKLFIASGYGAKNALADSTKKDYESVFKLYVERRLGRMRVADVEPDHIIEVRTDALKVSESRWRHTHVMLNSFFQVMSEPGEQYVRPDNPVRNIGRALRPRQEQITPVSDEAVLTIGERDAIAEHFEASSEGVKTRAIFELLPETGLRINEILALDLKRHVRYPVHEAGTRVLPEAIMVEQQLRFRFKSHVPTTWFAPVKGRQDISGSQVRTVGLSPYAARKLQEYIDHADAKGWFRRNADVVLLFPNSLGRPMRSNHVWAKMQDAATAAGMRKVTLHWLRHTFAATQRENGTSIEDLREALGHSSVRVTEKRYAHRTEKAKYVASIAAGGRQ
jgi:integrase